MNTRITISLICILGGVVPSLARRGATGSTIFTALAVIGSLAALGLMAYAAFRERTTDDKSERVSPKEAAMIFCGIGLWLGFVFYHAMTH